MRRLAWCVAAFSLVAAVLAVPRSVGASGELAAVEVTRYGGADRYETSLLVAEEIARLEGGRLEWVVMVPGNSWTDAVVAAPLAGKLGAPVLVTPSGELRADAARFLDRVEVTNAVLIGADSDTSGIGPGVVAGLEGLGIVVERVTGADQYETSVAVARRMGAPSYLEWSHRGVILASGEVFADALVAGVIAARSPLPILLTPPDRRHIDPPLAGSIGLGDLSARDLQVDLPLRLRGQPLGSTPTLADRHLMLLHTSATTQPDLDHLSAALPRRTQTQDKTGAP